MFFYLKKYLKKIIGLNRYRLVWNIKRDLIEKVDVKKFKYIEYLSAYFRFERRLNEESTFEDVTIFLQNNNLDS